MALFGLVLLAILRSWHGTKLDSFMVDEPFHMVSGISYVKTGDFRLNPEHPPLTKLWVGWLAPKDFKLRPFERLNDKYAERNYLEETMFYDNDFEAAQQSARIAMWLFNGVLMIVLLLLVWHLWRFQVALVLGALMVLEPTLSAHMPVVMTDLPLALALAINAFVATLFSRGWRWYWALALAVATGVSLSIKFSALPGVVAIYLILFAVALKPLFSNTFKAVLKPLGLLLLAGVFSVVLLWASYGFQYHASPDGSDPFNRPLVAKIEDLSESPYKSMLHWLDQSQLLPKAYVWGLADTVRAGVEGRGRPLHVVYGHRFKGDPPWFFWPAVMTSKLPIPYLFLFGFCVLLWSLKWRQKKSEKADNSTEPMPLSLTVLMSMAGFYLVTLMHSAGTYAGIRHALPLVVAMLLFSGVVITTLTTKIRRPILAVVLLSTLLLTVQEKRLWEYHNETVGGTKNAYRYFLNEGLDLGQRVKEIESYIKDNDLMKLSRFNYAWLIKEELAARDIPFSSKLKGIDDDNYAGVFEGYFFMNIRDLLPWEGWDPSRLDMLDFAQRIGNIYIKKGRYVDPKEWARLMRHEVKRHVLESSNPDWQQVIRSLERVVSELDFYFDTYVDLGNAYIKTQQRQAAIDAYKRALTVIDPSKKYREKIIAQINVLETGTPWAEVQILRSDHME